MFWVVGLYKYTIPHQTFNLFIHLFISVYTNCFLFDLLGPNVTIVIYSGAQIVPDMVYGSPFYLCTFDMST